MRTDPLIIMIMHEDDDTDDDTKFIFVVNDFINFSAHCAGFLLLLLLLLLFLFFFFSFKIFERIENRERYGN